MTGTVIVAISGLLLGTRLFLGSSVPGISEQVGIEAKFGEGIHRAAPPYDPQCDETGPLFPTDIARDIALISDCDGYLLEGFGGLHPLGAAPSTSGNPYFPNFDIARELVLVFDGGTATGGYVLDGWGGMHPFMISGGATPPTAPANKPYWAGIDIARDVWITESSASAISGYLLDGRGAMHPFGDASAFGGTPYFSGDIAREIAVLPGQTEATGYILDGLGAMHPFGGAPPLSGLPYFGFDIANDALLTGGSSGFMLDGFGGVHPFGDNDSPNTSHPYTLGTDTYRSFDLVGGRGYIMSRQGQVFEWDTFGPVE